MRWIYKQVEFRRPDLRKFSVELHRRCSRLWREATQEFLRAIVTSDVIQMDTGMSKASLLPLSRAVRMLTTVRASINPKREAQKGFTDISGGWHKEGERSIAHGEQLGRDAYTLTFGSANNPTFTFVFEIQVYQYLLHENNVLPGGTGPWRSLEIGQAAFIEYIDKHSPEVIPPIQTWWVK